MQCFAPMKAQPNSQREDKNDTRQRMGAIYCIATPQASTQRRQTSRRKDLGRAVSLVCARAACSKNKKDAFCTFPFYFVLQSGLLARGVSRIIL